MMKKTMKKYALRLLPLFLLCLFMVSLVFSWSYAAAVYAAETASIETTDPLDDLDGAVIGGKEFSLDDYPWNTNSVPQMIYFAEVGYSFYADNLDDYALYIYVYNPSGFVFDDSSYNKIEMAFGKTNLTYSKYTLELLSYSTAGGYEGLFYKFKVTLSDSQKSTALSKLDSNARVYTIVSMELAVGGVITDYVVGYNSDTGKGSVYTYTGYTLGYGSSLATEGSLECTVEGFSSYLALDVEQTVYRPAGDYYLGEQSQLNSCWFTIPNEYIEGYGELTGIKYEWYEYVTKPMLVTENSTIYNKLYNLHGAAFSELSDFYFIVSAWGNFDSALFNKNVTGVAYLNFEPQSSYSWWDGIAYRRAEFAEGDYSSKNFAAVFYTGSTGYEDYSVSAADVQAQLLLNSQYLGDTSIVGKYAASLFEDYVQDGRTKGYNLAESEGELEIYWNTTTKSTLWQKLFGGLDVDTTYDSVEALYTVTSSDLTGTNAEIAARLYISESDVTALKARYYTARANDETLVLFRYGSTAYYSQHITQAYSNSYYDGVDEDLVKSMFTDYIDGEYSGYVAQQTVFLNFDIISLTFTNEDGVSTEIPVVMSPQDVISGLTPPLEESLNSGCSGSISTVFMVLMLLLLLIILLPLLPYILNIVVWVISIPFKIIASFFKGLKRRRKDKDTS